MNDSFLGYPAVLRNIFAQCFTLKVELINLDQVDSAKINCSSCSHLKDFKFEYLKALNLFQKADKWPSNAPTCVHALGGPSNRSILGTSGNNCIYKDFLWISFNFFSFASISDIVNFGD